MAVRRLRDAGYWPRRIFIGLVPVVGGIILLVMLVQGYAPRNNIYS